MPQQRRARTWTHTQEITVPMSSAPSVVSSVRVMMKMAKNVLHKKNEGRHDVDRKGERDQDIKNRVEGLKVVC